jgi:tripartite-type tricarboxylate transporter receptor subunit TctC
VKFSNLPLRALAAAALSLAAAGAGAAFPEKELLLTINYGAGSNTDVASRILAAGLERELGKPVVPENRAGALGTLSVTLLAQEKPNPYHVGVVTYATQAISPHLMTLNYTMDDFQFVCGFGRYRYGVAVRADSPYKTIGDLVEAAKKKSIFFGGSSTPNLIALLELGRVTGGKFEQVPYKSGAETATALLSNQVEAIVQNPSDIFPFVQGGRMRLLASASPIRWSESPDTLTLREAGYPVEVDSWLGLAVRAGAPADAVKRLESACLGAVNNPETKKRIADTGVDPAGLTGAQYLQALKEGYQKMGEAIRAAKLPRMN